ncbi:hypothetical protein AAVH_34222, partial [Aphelenchoides avenae]
VLSPQVRTEQDSLCPQSEWKSLIEQNIDADVEATKFSIQRAFFEHYESKFFVTCDDGYRQQSPKFVSNGEGFCVHENKKIQ